MCLENTKYIYDVIVFTNKAIDTSNGLSAGILSKVLDKNYKKKVLLFPYLTCALGFLSQESHSQAGMAKQMINVAAIYYTFWVCLTFLV